MKEIVSWLIGVEDWAGKFYEKAAARFADDRELSTLLRELSEDEKLHHEVVSNAYELIKGKKDHPPHISLDVDTKKDMGNYASTCEEKLGAGGLTKSELLDAVITIENSEVNGLFLYVLNALKEKPEKFLPAVANIRTHKDRIKKFVEARPEFRSLLEKVRRMSDMVKENLLVVDDEKAVVNVFNILLKDHGNVNVASNGKEALDKLSEKYYAAVITDVDMPVMNGIEFYNEAVRKFPNIKDRFVFLTGSFDRERFDFFKNNDLRFLEKPPSIRDVRRSVAEIIEAKRRHL